MSLHTVTLNFLSLKPSIQDLGDRLIFKSTWLYRLCYLFACWQHVVFDHAARNVSVIRRRWWFLKSSESIPYDSIEEVGFKCDNWIDLGGNEPFWGDQYEYVWLVLKIKGSDKIIKLTSFEGEGSIETGFIGVLLGDSIIDFRGNHAEAANAACRTIREVIAQK